MKRLALLVALVTGLLAAGAATAIATPDTVFGHNSVQQSGGTAMGKVGVRVDEVRRRFSASGGEQVVDEHPGHRLPRFRGRAADVRGQHDVRQPE